MGVVNTTKSIFQKAIGNNGPSVDAAVPAPEEQQMPVDPAPDDIGPDEVEEDERDRQGNTDPGTNVPVDDPEAIRRNALIAASNKILAESIAQAAADAGPQVYAAAPVRVQSFKYLSIGHDKGMFHITGTTSLGEAFTETVDAPPNLTVAGVVEYLEGIAQTK